MTEKYFLDTNFLVYLLSDDEPEKRKKCFEILKNSKRHRRFVLSTQVIKEFTSVMIGKHKLYPLEVKPIIDKLCEYEVLTIQIEMIKDAIDIHLLNKLSFWDSLILSTAISSKCDYILTEDMQHDQIIKGVQIKNPFDLTF